MILLFSLPKYHYWQINVIYLRGSWLLNMLHYFFSHITNMKMFLTYIFVLSACLVNEWLDGTLSFLSSSGGQSNLLNGLSCDWKSIDLVIWYLINLTITCCFWSMIWEFVTTIWPWCLWSCWRFPRRLPSVNDGWSCDWRKAWEGYIKQNMSRGLLAALNS